MDPLDPLFPHLLRTARTLLGWDQTELSVYSGVSRAFISRLERGERLGQARKLIQLRDALRNAGVAFEVADGLLEVRLEGQRAREVQQRHSRGE